MGTIGWDEFKAMVSGHKREYRKFIYRGQASSKWILSSSLLRTGLFDSHEYFVKYFEIILPMLNEHVEAWTGVSRNLDDPVQLAQFLSLIQHNGFPTPLLDWSFSPYVAAYFAFDEINHFTPQTDNVAIYCFNHDAWLSTFGSTPDYKVIERKVDVISPKMLGNHKQMLQQSAFMFSNVNDIEGHIKCNEKLPGQFLTKYELSVKERRDVLRDLGLMGVTAMQLAPSLESVCRKVYHDVCSNLDVGLTPSDIRTSTLQLFATKNKGALPSLADFALPTVKEDTIS